MNLSVLLPGMGFPKLRSSVTLLQACGQCFLVDTGLCEDEAKLVVALAKHGLSPDDINGVVSTHLHYDHCGNHLLFRKARYYLSTRDYDDTASFILAYHRDTTPDKRNAAELLRSRHQSFKDFYIRSIVREVKRNLLFYNCLLSGDPRFVLLRSERWLNEEIQVISTPGHTPGHLSAVAHCVDLKGRMEQVLIAGDAVFTHRQLTSSQGHPNIHLAANTQLHAATRQTLLDEYRYIVPGHNGFVDTEEIAEPEVQVA